MFFFVFAVYLNHAVVLILPTAVVCVQVNRLFTVRVVTLEMVEQANNCVGSFAGSHSLVNKVVHI